MGEDREEERCGMNACIAFFVLIRFYLHKDGQITITNALSFLVAASC